MTDAAPDPCPNLPVERGPRGDGVGAWVVQDKYRYLRHYLDSARFALMKWPQRVYLDPFCATGRVQVRGEPFTRPGGAVEAWNALAATPGRWTKMLVGDLAAERSAACAQRLQALGAQVTAFTGPAAETVPEMVRAVPPGALCIAFLDPYNLALLEFEMLRALAALKVDLIIHFSTMDLTRNSDAELDPRRARFDQTAPGWREQPWVQHTSKANLSLELAAYWQKLVESLGFGCSAARPLITNDRRDEIYRLVFFARHGLPHKLWAEVARNPTLDLF